MYALLGKDDDPRSARNPHDVRSAGSPLLALRLPIRRVCYVVNLSWEVVVRLVEQIRDAATQFP